MRMNEGAVRVKPICKNAKLPVRGTAGAVGYDLAAAQVAILSAHGKMVVKIRLAMAQPPDCYGKIDLV